MVPYVEPKVIGEVVATLLSAEAKSATKYLSDKLVVRASRPVYKEKLDGAGKRARRIGVVLTIGEPNHEAREFIKRCKKLGEPLPVRRIQLKFLTKT